MPPKTIATVLAASLAIAGALLVMTEPDATNAKATGDPPKKTPHKETVKKEYRDDTCSYNHATICDQEDKRQSQDCEQEAENGVINANICTFESTEENHVDSGRSGNAIADGGYNGGNGKTDYSQKEYRDDTCSYNQATICDQGETKQSQDCEQEAENGVINANICTFESTEENHIGPDREGNGGNSEAGPRDPVQSAVQTVVGMFGSIF